jgi:hypothetical protein
LRKNPGYRYFIRKRFLSPFISGNTEITTYQKTQLEVYKKFTFSGFSLFLNYEVKRDNKVNTLFKFYNPWENSRLLTNCSNGESPPISSDTVQKNVLFFDMKQNNIICHIAPVLSID